MFRREVFSVFALGALFAFAIPNLSIAEEPVCISGQAVLRDAHGTLSNKRHSAVKEVFIEKKRDSRTILAQHHSSANNPGAKVLCATEHNPCFKGYRLARAKNFSTFVKLKNLTCDPNYVLHIGAKTIKKPKNRLGELLKDSLLRRLKFFNTTERFNIGVFTPWKNGVRGSRDTLVAVIDTGVDYTHPDLIDNVMAPLGRNFVDADGTDESISADPFDDNGHGTHVAGTIGALGNNGIGLVGVNWEVSIIPLKFLDASGSGSLFGALEALEYSNELFRQGYNIVATNNSWGGGGYSQSLADAIEDAKSLGILFIAAAGNEANDNDEYPSYPASYDSENIISVAALEETGDIAYFSNYGPQSVDIAAPGVDIASTYTGGRYAVLSGTSMATPHVTGAVALLRSAHPNLDWRETKNRILSTAVQVRGLSSSVGKGRFLNVERLIAGRTSTKKLSPLY